MEYRKLPHGKEQISIIGMGSSVVGEQKESDIIKTVEYALDAGIAQPSKPSTPKA